MSKDPVVSPVVRINSAGDYEKAAYDAKAAADQVISDLITTNPDGWRNDPNSLTRIAEAQLPYTRAMADPHNAVAAAAGSEAYLRNNPNAKLVTAADNPDLIAMVKSDTASNNALTGNNYPPPKIIAVPGLEDRDRTMAAYVYDKQVVLVDAKYLKDPSKLAQIAPVVGHEIGHYFQRSDAALRNNLKIQAAEKTGITPDAATLDEQKGYENQADFRGARVTSPIAMENVNGGLPATVSYFAEKNGLSTYDQSKGPWNALSPDKQQSYKDAYAALPPADQSRYLDMAEKDIIPRQKSSDGRHADPIDNARMLHMLRDHPEMLRQNLEFDGKGHPTNATEAGTPSTPVTTPTQQSAPAAPAPATAPAAEPHPLAAALTNGGFDASKCAGVKCTDPTPSLNSQQAAGAASTPGAAAAKVREAKAETAATVPPR